MIADDQLATDLKAFGLDEIESQTYIRLARLGRARASLLSSALKTNRTTTYRVLERLKQMGIVESSLTRPASFIAVEPKRALQLLIERRRDELKAAESRYPAMIERLAQFYAPPEEEEEGAVAGAKFNILQGSEEIHRAITRLAKAADKKISLITTVRDLGKMYYSGTYEALSEARTRGVSVQIVTEVPDLPSLEVVRQYEFAEVRHHTAPKMKMAVKDDEEALITVSGSSEEEEVALWAHSQPFASAMQATVDNDFYSGIGLAAIATSLKTGKPAESLRVIAGGQEYTDSLLALLASARSEIIIGFSFYPTFAAPAVLEMLNSLARGGVKVKVLSVPSPDEIEIVRRLHGPVEFRISAFQTDVQVIVVDGREMIFSNSPKAHGRSAGLNIIITNLTGMVSFLHQIMADVWLDSRGYILELDMLQQYIALNGCINRVKSKMREKGIEIEVGTKILGRSGVLHKFDIISPRSDKGSSRVAVAFLAHTSPEATAQKLMECRIKLLDCEPIELLVGMLAGPAKEGAATVEKLSRAAGLAVIHASDGASLAEAVLAEIEKRY